MTENIKKHRFSIFLITLPIIDYIAIFLTTQGRVLIAAGLLLMFHGLMITEYMRNANTGLLHSYHIGLLMTLSGSYLVRTIGFVLMIFDAYQHEKQTYYPAYRSIPHLAATPLYIAKRDLIKITGWTWLKKL